MPHACLGAGHALLQQLEALGRRQLVGDLDPRYRFAEDRDLVMLLTEHAAGEVIRSSDFYKVVRDRGASLAHTTEILQAMGILRDDRPQAFEQWLVGKLDGLAAGIGWEVQRWARTLREGGPCTQPRKQSTVQRYLRAAHPALLAWSASYQHLRQVTHADVVAYVEALHGERRLAGLVALRSLFGWARTNGVVFANPTRHIRVGRRDDPVLQPLLPEEVARTVQAATTPQARLVVALAAVHAARPGAIRAMRLDNVDLANRRLTIAGQTRPLDELTHKVLLAWLDHRRRRWPDTANPHLLVSARTAVGLGPVSAPGINLALRGLPATLERLRVDRQLEEALTHQADPLHLAVIFDLDASTAMRYAASARQLLGRPHDAGPRGLAANQVPLGDNSSDEHSGSR